MDLVKARLLDGLATLAGDDRSGSLACLSVRFALESNMDGPLATWPAHRWNGT